jgi:predicted nucleic acid-binding protein
MIVVADASPLRYLVLIGEVELLPALYGDVLIPSEVVNELTRPRTPESVRRWISGAPQWLQVRVPFGSPSAFPDALGNGEREAIMLAEELHADALLVDDWAARQEAARRNLLVIGTLRILSSAAEKGMVDLPSAIARLRTTNFRASNERIQSVLDADAKRKRR